MSNINTSKELLHINVNLKQNIYMSNQCREKNNNYIEKREKKDKIIYFLFTHYDRIEFHGYK